MTCKGGRGNSGGGGIGRNSHGSRTGGKGVINVGCSRSAAPLQILRFRGGRIDGMPIQGRTKLLNGQARRTGTIEVWSAGGIIMRWTSLWTRGAKRD